MKRLISMAAALVMCMTFAACGAPKAIEPDAAQVFDVEKRTLQTYLDLLLADPNGNGSHDTGETLNRTAFSDGEKLAADRIEQEFRALGLKTEMQEFTATVNKAERTSRNVIGVYAGTDSASTVLIGAHYDNMYGTPDIAGSGSHGAYSSASGIATMLAAAKALTQARTQLPFDVRFVAFGAGEVGNLGSEYYVSQMSVTERNSMPMMISLDLIGGGDYLYLYAEEQSTVHESYFFETAKDLKIAGAEGDIALREPPANKRTFGTSEGYPPIHYGSWSDNYHFLKNNINCAAYFSLNWEVNNIYGVAESATKEAILYTRNDTLEKLKELYPDYLAKMEFVAEHILSTITRGNFVEMAAVSAQEKGDTRWLYQSQWWYLITIGAMVLIGVGLFFLAKHWTKKYPAPKVEPVKPESIFSDVPPPPENPFEGY